MQTGKITALYVRFSFDDGIDTESGSIEHQKALLKNYAESNGFTNLSYYADDGYTGTNFNRPNFQRMMNDIKNGLVGTVIVKDMSRLGRNYLMVGQYVEIDFPKYDVRFIAISDNVDSAKGMNDLLPINNLMNEWYSRDISKKIRGSFLVQKKQGKYMSGFAPYGYRKDPADRHRFLIDDAAAEVVRKIYRFYLEGYSVKKIAEILNDQQILSPTEYKTKIQNLSYVNRQGKNQVQKWNTPTIYNILKNQVYTGAMVQHKTEKISYKIEKYRNIPMEERYVVEGMHEAIISKELFAMAQEKRQRFKNRNS